MNLIKLCLIVLSSVAFLAGCFREQSFEEFFHEEMERYEDRGERPYTLVHHEENVVQEDDAIAVFEETNPNGEQIFIAYFEIDNGSWRWGQTTGAEWEDFVNWSVTSNFPYIYAGATQDEMISEVHVGDERAEIIEVENEKRYWFSIHNQDDLDVKFVMEDGTEEYVEWLDYDSLENEYGS
ncbi:hypothetical protein [Alteribacter natronophilus]|uniref:hypothetical protein n=1 Tax=Alteribacter natronophilus TaxID=2583810 RepID=UPI00110DE040|nr:hypothetical protein [Alteribacter natronophilus]TMW70564.1 hypothetical protein FGB90_15355 [Alteribacter natronophilus]